jgi:Ni,Fe-hydrogenase III component G
VASPPAPVQLTVRVTQHLHAVDVSVRIASQCTDEVRSERSLQDVIGIVSADNHPEERRSFPDRHLDDGLRRL